MLLREAELDKNLIQKVRLVFTPELSEQERFKEWELSGVKVVPVLSQPDDGWSGETGYVQAAFARAKQVSKPEATGVVLCGQRQMAEEITAMLEADGVSNEKILKNF